MRAGRVVQLVAGAVVAVVGLPLLLAALALAWLHVAERDDDGWFTTGTEELSTTTRALTSTDVDLGGSPAEDDWIPFDGELATVRLRATAPDGTDLFVGIGPADDVAAYLDGVAHEVVRDGLFEPGAVRTDVVDGDVGGVAPPAPASQAFWVASGDGTLTWDVEAGDWTVVVMRADGGAGFDAAVSGGVRVGWLLAAAVTLGVVGTGMVAGGTWAVVAAARTTRTGAEHAAARPGTYPVRLDGRLDEPLSRWLWLVKWLLAVPHLVVLAFLWVAYACTTVVAFVAILVTGRYPRALFDFGVGVLRWTWRVGFYAFSAIGTDRYPPFSLAPDPSYPCGLDVAYPERLSRGLVLVKWWLLAIPHYVVVAVLTGGVGLHAGGAVTALVVVAGVVLLASGTYPQALFDVVVGADRWAYRVAAYALLLTDEYPPFRFDGGGTDPATVATGTPDPTDWPPPPREAVPAAGVEDHQLTRF